MRKATAHLTDEEFALYADAIILNSSDRLPNKILRHVMECNRCKKKLMELLNLIQSQNRTLLRKHIRFSDARLFD